MAAAPCVGSSARRAGTLWPADGLGVDAVSERVSRRRRTLAALIAFVVLAAIALMLTNSRLGAYILLDYLTDDDSGLVADPAAGPLELSEFVTAVAADALPGQIDQPSGLTYLEADGAFAIVTDQAELFVVSDDFTDVRSVTALAGGLLVTRQGVMEGGVAIDGQRVAVSGDMGRIDVWRRDSGRGSRWSRRSRCPARPARARSRASPTTHEPRSITSAPSGGWRSRSSTRPGGRCGN